MLMTLCSVGKVKQRFELIRVSLSYQFAHKRRPNVQRRLGHVTMYMISPVTFRNQKKKKKKKKKKKIYEEVES